MATNEKNNSSRRDGDRERRRDAVVNTVKERPYTAAALATVAAGAAFFLTRSKSDKPLMNWGQETQGDHVKGAGAYKQQGSATADRSLETAGAPTSSASPSAAQAADLAAAETSTNAAVSGGTGSSTSPAAKSEKSGSSASGLDQTAKTDAKVGAISYGA